MLKIHTFTFNAFFENTYLLYEPEGDGIIIDPGCYEDFERKQLADFISNQKSRPVRLLNTHCHIDHILGNKFVADTYELKLEISEGEHEVLTQTMGFAELFNLRPDPPPDILYLDLDTTITIAGASFTILFTPGHSPASICFYCEKENILIGGDVLFRDSIGRTDLPGGNHQTLLNSIKTKLWPLSDDTIVYPGHGPETTIGYEKRNNPFLQGL